MKTPIWAVAGLFLFPLLTVGCGTESASVLMDHTTGPTARIGTFNFKRLGEDGEDKDLDRMADLIDSADYDIFAGTEIMTKDAAHELHDKLRERSGDEWRMRLSRKANGESHYKEWFAYFYCADTVRPINDENTFCRTNQATQRTSSSCYAKDLRTNNRAQFNRDPFVGHFEVNGQEMSFLSLIQI